MGAHCVWCTRPKEDFPAGICGCIHCHHVRGITACHHAPCHEAPTVVCPKCGIRRCKPCLEEMHLIEEQPCASA